MVIQSNNPLRPQFSKKDGKKHGKINSSTKTWLKQHSSNLLIQIQKKNSKSIYLIPKPGADTHGGDPGAVAPGKKNKK